MVLQERLDPHVARRVARRAACFSHDVACDLDLGRLGGGRVHAVVPDERIRHHQDLAAVRRVRERLAVPRHVRVKHEFPIDRARRAENEAADDGPVLQDEGTFHRCRPSNHYADCVLGLTSAKTLCERHSPTLRTRSSAAVMPQTCIPEFISWVDRMLPMCGAEWCPWHLSGSTQDMNSGM